MFAPSISFLDHSLVVGLSKLNVSAMLHNLYTISTLSVLLTVVWYFRRDIFIGGAECGRKWDFLIGVVCGVLTTEVFSPTFLGQLSVCIYSMEHSEDKYISNNNTVPFFWISALGYSDPHGSGTLRKSVQCNANTHNNNSTHNNTQDNSFQRKVEPLEGTQTHMTPHILCRNGVLPTELPCHLEHHTQGKGRRITTELCYIEQCITQHASIYLIIECCDVHNYYQWFRDRSSPFAVDALNIIFLQFLLTGPVFTDIIFLEDLIIERASEGIILNVGVLNELHAMTAVSVTASDNLDRVLQRLFTEWAADCSHISWIIQ